VDEHRLDHNALRVVQFSALSESDAVVVERLNNRLNARRQIGIAALKVGVLAAFQRGTEGFLSLDQRCGYLLACA
jgi:hypothetical protein